ncbi:paraquat-inducible protein A [Marinomonas ostreistagni]|uniref:paraquat-inducible protein A n=1 Tax=Marinomonas ostreistagni TaxID=359209 RepID=UPI0019510899|nr:paraquat-inducible protein A [Marinomonas ostreistagni]MBM6551576.1 paraquat-inducible protein A [Marinomonas ostreistagni]
MPKQKAHCPRCDHVLTMLQPNWAEKMLALSCSALLLLVLALTFSFLSFDINGLKTSITLFSVVETLAEQMYLGLAILIFTVCIALPGCVLVMLVMWGIAIKWQLGVTAAQAQIRWCFSFLKWCMPEVFIVGALISMVKLVAMADIGLGPAFYFYGGFIVMFILTLMHLDRRQIELALLKKIPTENRPIRAQQRLQWTWALLLTSVLLYLPANLLPIMTTQFLGDAEPSTIVAGVITMWQNGSYFIAMVIFIASIMVPIFKILALAFLSYSVQSRRSFSSQQRYILYRVTELMGRWSMIDVFVVAILAGLVQLGSTMSVFPGPAVVAFCAVVILTMLAALSFDSRLLWEQES